MIGNCLFRLLIATAIIALTNGTARAGQGLDSFIQERMAAHNLPGLAAGIVKNDGLVWSAGYGAANLEDSVPATAETLWLTASVSKTVAAAALMRLKQAGRFFLDEPINNHLPFQVNHPFEPGRKITFRALLSHVSSIADNPEITDPLYVQGDSPLPLGGFLRDYLTPGGAYYSARNNFGPDPPEAAYDYTNVGYGLVGYLVEAVGGLDFAEFCRQNFFEPLGMTGVGWFMAGLDPSRVAMPYAFDRRTGRHQPLGHYGFPDYPSGQLRAGVNQMALFLRAFINGGGADGAAVLDPATVAEMLTVQYPGLDPEQGLGWYSMTLDGREVWGHSGGEQGAAAEMFFCREDGAGVIMFTNGDLETDEAEQAWEEIMIRLFQEAERY